MCRFLLNCFLLALLLTSSAYAQAAPQAGEPGMWYLISEQELRNIEQYLEKSEQEKQNWLSQAAKLRSRAENLEADSGNLNRQLTQAREARKRLEQSYAASERELLDRLSLKNGEIDDLKQELSAEMLAKMNYKRQAALRLIVIISGAVTICLFIAFKVCRFLKLI